MSIPALYKLSPVAAQAFADEIARYATLSAPSLLIEDTHPAPVSWPQTLEHLLILRPTMMLHMRRLRQECRGAFRGVFACDHPESPTWPYSESETAEILTWDGWHLAGPLYRRHTRYGVERVRHKYNILDDQQIFVFSMGAGGQKPGSSDRVNFVRSAERVTRQLKEYFPNPRFIFVCGPLFPQDQHIPQPFEVVQQEPEMPSLLACAHGAIIRPGNTLWECIGAGTPIMPILGSSYLEPVQQRLEKLQASGLELGAIASWADGQWQEHYKRKCESVVERFPGSPPEDLMSRLFAVRRPNGNVASSFTTRSIRDSIPLDSFSTITMALRAIKFPKPLVIRMDDVVGINPAIDWLFRICRDYGLSASLEIIPYLAHFNEAQLDKIDQDQCIEVSQHGFAHLPDLTTGPPFQKGELVSNDPVSSRTGPILLRRGIRLMKKLFPERFKCGYSAPYDVIPSWLPAAWAQMGGKYISWIRPGPCVLNINNVRVTVDPWNWRAPGPQTVGVIAHNTLFSVRNYGYVGLVLHPQNLYERSHRMLVESLIAAIVEGGCTGSRISEVSTFTAV